MSDVATKWRMDGHELTEQQRGIVEAILAGHNVNVIAKAGSGKTVTSVYALNEAIRRYPKRKAIVLMFNKNIKEETRDSVKKVKNIDVHSFHSCARKYFNVTNPNSDACFEEALTQQPKIPVDDVHYIVVDEAQDVTPLYHRFIRHLLSFIPKAQRQLVLVGDPFQTINQYKGATMQYLVEPQRYYGDLLSGDVVLKHLSISWRISHEMAAFINQYCNPTFLAGATPTSWWEKHGDCITALWGEGIRAAPTRPADPDSLQYVAHGALYAKTRGHLNAQRRSLGGRDFLKKLRDGMDTYGTNVTLVAHSVKNKSSGTTQPIVQNIVNAFGKAEHENWHINSAGFLSDPSPKAVRTQKRIANTINSMKGCEDDFVIFPQFDYFYHKLTTLRNDDPWVVFNKMYTALTRAKKRLLVACGDQAYVTFYRGEGLSKQNQRQQPKRRQTMNVKKMLTHVPYDAYLDHNTVQTSDYVVSAAVQQKIVPHALANAYMVKGRVPGTKEYVAPILGKALEFALHYRLYGENSYLRACSASCANDADMHMWLDTEADERLHDATADTFFKMALLYQYAYDGYLAPWRQLRHHTWETYQAILDGAVDNTLYVLYAIAFPESPLPTSLRTIADALAPCVVLQRPVLLPWCADWFTKRNYDPIIQGVVDVFLKPNTYVELKISRQRTFNKMHAHQVQLYATMGSLMKGAYQRDVTKPRAFVVIANTGAVYDVALQEPNKHYAYMNRMLRRKIATNAYDLRETSNRNEDDEEQTFLTGLHKMALSCTGHKATTRPLKRDLLPATSLPQAKRVKWWVK